MHNVQIRQEIIDRVMDRRKRLHIFDELEAKRTALIIIDMQNTFCRPGAPAEVPKAREISRNINRLAAELRARGGKAVWVTHANIHDATGTDWDHFFNNFVADSVRQKTIESLSPNSDGQTLWRDLEPDGGDIFVTKNRYSALIPGSSQLERILRSHGIENLLIVGTKTNVCCEATARDAMMMDFRVIMVSDCMAALSDEEHRASLETFIQQFGDVRTGEEIVSILVTR